MKKRVLLALVLCMVEAMLCVGVVGCGASEPVEEQETQEETTDDEEEAVETEAEEQATVEPTKTPEPTPEPTPEAVEEEKDAFDSDEAIADGANLEKKDDAKVDSKTEATDEVTEVERYYVEDCGQDTGYWVVKYSDGHEEYIEE